MVFLRSFPSASVTLFFLLLGGCVLGLLQVPRAVTGPFTTDVAIRPWEVAVVLVVVALLGAFLLRRVTLRLLMELLLGFFLLFGVWFLAWWVWGESGLFVAALFTVVQAWIRTVWMHNVFLLVGAVGAIFYLAFLLPLLTWVALVFVLVVLETVKRRTAALAARLTQSVVHRGIVPLFVFPATLRGWARPFVQEAQTSSAFALGVTSVVLPGIVVAHLAVLQWGFAMGAVAVIAAAAGFARVRAWPLSVSVGIASMLCAVTVFFVL